MPLGHSCRCAHTGSLAVPKLNVDKGLDIVVGQSPAILLRVVDIQVALHYAQCLLVRRDAGDVLELGPDIAEGVRSHRIQREVAAIVVNVDRRARDGGAPAASSMWTKVSIL